MPTVRYAALATAIALTVTGCALGPDYPPPEPAVPMAWETATTALGVWPDDDWWRGFASAELNQLIARATAGSPDLAAAMQRIRQAEAQARIAGAPLYPFVSADGDVSRSWAVRSATGRTTTLGNGTTAVTGGSDKRVASTVYQANLRASYQVDLFGGNAAAADAAGLRVASSRYDRAAVAITLHADVARTYFQLLSLRDRIRLASETLQIAEEVLALLESRRAAGLSSELEVAQQRSAVASQRSAVLALQLSERQTLDALAVLLGRPPQGLTVAGRSLDQLRLPDLAAGLPSELLQRRPDVRRAEAEIKAANLDVVVARAARFPSLDLSAGASLQSAALSTFFDSTALAYSIAASLTAPLFQGGRLEAQEDLSEARFREVIETWRAAVVAAFRDVEDALAAADISERQYQLSVIAFNEAREAYRIVNARFRAGTVDFLNVLDAQRTVFQTNDSLVQAALLRFTAMVDLYQALGGGFEDDLPVDGVQDGS